MIDMMKSITAEDRPLFNSKCECPRDAHIIKNAPFLTFHDCLLSYDPNTSQPYPEDKRPPFIISIGEFRDTNPEIYTHMLKLYKRAKLAAIKAVTKRWADENPLDYIDFLNSDLSIFEYAKKFDKHKPKVKQSTSSQGDTSQ